jgi:hypothetical protein
LQQDPKYGTGFHRIIIMLGDNDLSVKAPSGKVSIRPGDPEDLKSRIVSMLMECRQMLLRNVPDVLLCTIMQRPVLGPSGDVFIRSINNDIGLALKKLDTRPVPLWRTLHPRKKNTSFHSDGIHLSVAGFKRLKYLLKQYC